MTFARDQVETHDDVPLKNEDHLASFRLFRRVRGEGTPIQTTTKRTSE